MKHLKITIFLLLAIFGSTSLHARLQGQARLDSLSKELPRQKEDTNKVKLLNAMSFDCNSVNPDEGIKYAQQSLELATNLDWEKGIANANRNLGISWYTKSDYTKALEYYCKALKLFEELGIKVGVAKTNNDIGLVYRYQGDYSKALEYFFKALKAGEEIGNKGGIAACTANIGLIYSSINDYPKALEYLFKALKLYEEIGNKEGIANGTVNIGVVYISQGDYSKALEYYFKAVKLWDELGNKGGIGGATNNIGIVYLKQKNYTAAAEHFQRSLKIREELGDKYGTAGSLCNIGTVYIDIVKDTAAKTSKVTDATELSVTQYQNAVPLPIGRAALIEGAIDYVQRALAICKEINAIDFTRECYESLSEAYKLKGDYKLAMVYGDSSRVIKDSVFSQENTKKIAKLENGRKAYGDSLKSVAEKRTADIKAAHRRNYELIGGGVILLLLGFTFLLKKNNKLLNKEKQQNETLLHNILPEEVAAQLKDTGKSAARQFDNVSVMFTDFVNFTEASERMKPEMLIEELDTCFKAFDEITAKYNIEKIKTIGDAYLAVCGLPSPDPKHAENVVNAAKKINVFMADRLSKMGSERTFAVRIGIHSGSVVAGIVGTRKFAYDIWGDTVNTAARMEQNSEAGKINISEITYELVKDKFSCEYRGEVEAKGKGVMKMYFVS